MRAGASLAIVAWLLAAEDMEIDFPADPLPTPGSCFCGAPLVRLRAVGSGRFVRWTCCACDRGWEHESDEVRPDGRDWRRFMRWWAPAGGAWRLTWESPPQPH